jgi:sporulation protein YlmC with PRC-barrel domain
MAELKGTLTRLKDSGRTLADPAEDVRGRKVRNTDGEELGTVEALLVDADEEKVRLLRVEHGGILGFGATPSYIPVEAVAVVEEAHVVIDLSKERLVGAPQYDPDLVDQRPYYESLYGYYGYAPFWSAGDVSPGHPPPDPGPTS